MATLTEKLKAHAASDFYPFHMPGHKRSSLSLGEPALLDITEITDFDDLHHETGILFEAEQRAAALWGAKESFLLVNGSTCGTLSAMSAAAARGSSALVAKNCHKSVWHGCFLNDFSVTELPPEKTSFGIDGAVSVKTMEAAFLKNPDAKLVVLTSPTYEGIVSDIAEIAAVTHRHGAVLLVDEAHGAHFGLHRELPRSAVTLGADLVVQSLHKTLPSLTQTAVLHRCGDRVSSDALRRFLDIYETSSPSYILLASIDRCVNLLLEKRDALFPPYLSMLSDFYASVRDLKHFTVLTDEMLSQTEAFSRDPGKLVIKSGLPEVDGKTLHQTLHEVYHLELERFAKNYVIAMTSICDRPEGFRRLTEALHELDHDPSICAEFHEIEDTAVDNLSEYEIYRGYDAVREL